MSLSAKAEIAMRVYAHEQLVNGASPAQALERAAEETNLSQAYLQRRVLYTDAGRAARAAAEEEIAASLVAKLLRNRAAYVEPDECRPPEAS